MKVYAKNSPEAVARILAMMMITDARLEDREIDIMDELRGFDLVGISRARFSEVLHDYCSELLALGGKDGRVHLIDKQRLNEIVDLVDEPRKRLLAAGLMLNIANADGKLDDTELVVFKYVLDRWGMTLESLEAEL
jgi:uncharacterized tellurite resistance protein B-like protein